MDAYTSPDSPSPSLNQPTAPPDWRSWAQRLLVCNPFFLVSAALLLFGVNRLSTDPTFLGGEEPKLLFNFGTLQLYGGLLALTAVLLARRRVWYDSALLVVLEHGLVLVPFILIGQAALIGRGLAAALIAAGAVAVALRAWSIRRWYPRFNLPPRALLLGVGILALNVTLPLWFRSVVEHESVYDWAQRNRLVWLAFLPALAAAANLLPRPVRHDGLNPERPWLPLFIYALWLGGSGVHAASVGYLGKGSSLTLALLAPTLLVSAWTLLNRFGDLTPRVSPLAQRLTLAGAAAVPLGAFAEPSVLLVLAAVNAIGFTALAGFGPVALRGFVRQLVMASLGICLVAVPVEWIALIHPDWGRPELVIAVLALYGLAASWTSRHPAIGIAAGLTLGFGLAKVADDLPARLITQLALLQMLGHSLRWNDSTDAVRVRWMAAGVWLLTLYVGSPVPLHGLVEAAALLVAAGLAWRLNRRPAAVCLFLTGLVGELATPVRWLVEHASAGLLSLLASFALFGLGAWNAWRRNHPSAGETDRGPA